MRQRRLVCSDFFSECIDGIRTEYDAQSYDLVIGNAPFGAAVITKEARLWAISGDRHWTIPNRDIGGLFLAKSAQLVTNSGRVALIQSANTLLFNIGSASKFRKQIFETHQIEEIYNLSALRFRIFQGKKHTTKKSVAPVCIIVMRREKANEERSISYISPKSLRPLVDEFTIVIEPNDYRLITVSDVVSDFRILSMLMWGGSRDIQLIQKLERYPSLKKIEKMKRVETRGGVVFGDRRKSTTRYKGKKLFDERVFPTQNILDLDTDKLPIVEQIHVHSRDSTSLLAFEWPQLIVKRSWHKSTGRFHARLNRSKDRSGVLCNQSYFSIHTDATILEAANLSHNSKVAVYFHFLTSGRFAAYRPKLSKDEVLRLPIPTPTKDLLDGIDNYLQLDRRAFELFDLKDAERVLIEDAIEYNLGDFLGRSESKGTQRTDACDADDTHLRTYCEYFFRVIKAGFGASKSITARIYRSPSEAIPYRLVAFVLGGTPDNKAEIMEIKSSALLAELKRLTHQSENHQKGLFTKSAVRIYQAHNDMPTVFIIKPDQKRFWTRSMGLQDGDEVALDLFRWKQKVSYEEDRTSH